MTTTTQPIPGTTLFDGEQARKGYAMRGHLPDEGDLVDLIPRIAPADDLRRRLLVDDPTRLYWKD
jgi:2-pyrone-4,6-dicarboxylate lactonase